MSVEHPNRHAARLRRLVRSSVIGVTMVALGAGAVSVSSAQAAQAKAAAQRVCSAVLSTGTDKAVLLNLPTTGGAGADSYDGYQAPARVSEWTDYSIEGDATTLNSLAVSFRQNASNGPSLRFSADKNALGPVRLNNGGWAADGTIQLPAGTLVPGEPFHFKIAVSGLQVTVQIDHVHVAQYSRPWLPASGTIGIRVTGSETGTLDNLVVRRLDTAKYLYADDFEGWATGTAGGTAAGYSGLDIVDGCPAEPPVDNLAPTVSAAPDDSTVYGDNGWITKATTLLVKAVDDVDPSPSVEVALDDAPPAPYTGPVAVEGDGTHVLKYSAKDASSNTSDVQTLTVKLDTTRPVPAFGTWPTGDIHEGEVPDAPACLGTDATSGVASCALTGYSKTVGQHTMTQTVVDQAGNRASASLNYTVVAADRDALGLALQAQSALAADDYTTSSWAGLMATVDGVDGAHAVYDGSGFSQAQVDAATAAVNAGVAALLERGDATALEALLVATRGMLDDLDGYTEASARALREAAAEAETVYTARADKTDAQLGAATSDLRSAVDGLTAQPDKIEKAALKHLYDQGKVMSNADGAFTQASWAMLQRELAEGGAVLADESATQTQVDQASAELTAALTGLVPVQAARPEPAVSRVKLNQTQLRLVKGKSVRLEEAVYFTSGPAAYAGAAVWKSSNPKIATVSSAGSIKARRTGKVTITVTSVKPGASGKKVSTRIRVLVVNSRSKAKVKKVRATVPKAMKVGQSAFLTGSYSSAAATGVKVTYRSSASSVAKVDVAGRVVARKKGTVKITVKAGGASRTYKITVR